MVRPNNGPNYLESVLRHKHALLFAGGVATAIVAKKVLESKVVKDATTDAVASIMAIKKDAEERMEEIRTEAEAIEEDAEEKKVEIEVEEVGEKPKKTSKKSKKSKK